VLFFYSSSPLFFKTKTHLFSPPSPPASPTPSEPSSHPLDSSSLLLLLLRLFLPHHRIHPLHHPNPTQKPNQTHSSQSESLNLRRKRKRKRRRTLLLLIQSHRHSAPARVVIFCSNFQSYPSSGENGTGCELHTVDNTTRQIRSTSDASRKVPGGKKGRGRERTRAMKGISRGAGGLVCCCCCC